jgi:site-specific recombinase XerD
LPLAYNENKAAQVAKIETTKKASNTSAQKIIPTNVVIAPKQNTVAQKPIITLKVITLPAVKKKNELAKTISFHSLRHSFATHLLEKGIDVIFIKDILRHFDIKTTERYLHVRKDFLINIESPLDDLYKSRKHI